MIGGFWVFWAFFPPENKVQHLELKMPEPRSLESQQQQCSFGESYRKQLEQIKQNCVNARKKMPTQEVLQKSCYGEVK